MIPVHIRMERSPVCLRNTAKPVFVNSPLIICGHTGDGNTRSKCGNAVMRQCGNEGRRALRSGAPAVTPSVSAQAGNAQCPMPNASRSVCRII